MALQSVRSATVTRATPLTVLRTATQPFEAHRAPARWTDLSRNLAPDLTLAVYKNLVTIETEWRRFQADAECTPFQSYEWLAAWQRHIGVHEATVPAIAVGRFADGETAFIAPLAVVDRKSARRLCWLGQELCDYNAPLLARDFSQRVTADRFVTIWRELCEWLQSDAELRHDWIDFEKMPETIGAQVNPFMHLGVAANANSAHITQLGEDWEAFYCGARSSSTRRRDRTKRKHMAEFGEIRFVTAAAPDDIAQTLGILWQQKKRIFTRKGIFDFFTQPGYRDFFLDFASSPHTRHLAHVSRLEVGDTCAAANFAITFGDCYYHVLSSYCDGELMRYGPGALHLRELLAHAINIGLRRFDFTIGDERYKSEWSDLRLRLFDYTAAVTWRGRPASILLKVRRRLKRVIKQSPLAWSVVSRIRSMLGPF